MKRLTAQKSGDLKPSRTLYWPDGKGKSPSRSSAVSEYDQLTLRVRKTKAAEINMLGGTVTETSRSAAAPRPVKTYRHRPTGVGALAPVPKRYDPRSKGTHPPQHKLLAEDRLRVRMLRRAAEQTSDVAKRERYLAVAKRIEARPGRITRTPASARYVGKYQARLAGNAWRMYEKGGRRARTLTLIPADTSYSPAELDQLDPRHLRDRMRKSLFRAGVTHKPGWLILCLHGEYEAEIDRYHLHWHGIGEGAALYACHQLREQARFKSVPRGQGSTRPVRIRKQALYDLPTPLTYCLQSWWPRRQRDQTHTRYRLPTPHHVEWLTWMDRWQLSDLILMVHVRVIGGCVQVR